MAVCFEGYVCCKSKVASFIHHFVDKHVYLACFSWKHVTNITGSAVRQAGIVEI